MAKLQFDWSSTASCDESATDALEALGAKAGRPTMVFVYERESDLKLLEGACGVDERVAIGAKAFRLVKLASDRIPKSGAIATTLAGRNGTRFLFFDAAGKRVASVEQVTPSRVYDAMKRTAGASLEGFVKEYTKFLNALDKVENEKATLKLKLDRLGAKAARDASVASRQRQIDADAEKLAASEKKILERIS